MNLVKYAPNEACVFFRPLSGLVFTTKFRPPKAPVYMYGLHPLKNTMKITICFEIVFPKKNKCLKNTKVPIFIYENFHPTNHQPSL